VPWKSVALPVEHGGWGFLVEPVALGLALAPSRAGLALALGAVAAFLARHPLKLVLTDRRRGVRYPRTALAEGFAVAYAGLAVAFLALALWLARTPFALPLVLAAPVGLLALAYDARGRSREALPEAAGAVALGASAAAIALAGGAPTRIALGAWLLLGLRAVASVLYVRARLRLDRGMASGRGTAVVSHLVALALAAVLARVAWGPWLGVAAFVALLLRAVHGLSAWRRTVRPQALGFQEMGFGLLTLILLAVGYRLGP
jgi:hypothetical protein